jgi:hypothetical protein
MELTNKELKIIDDVISTVKRDLKWNQCELSNYTEADKDEKYKVFIEYSGLEGSSILKDIRESVKSVTKNSKVFVIINQIRNTPHIYGILLFKK